MNSSGSAFGAAVGIGLAMARGIAKLANGRLSSRREPWVVHRPRPGNWKRTDETKKNGNFILLELRPAALPERK